MLPKSYTFSHSLYFDNFLKVWLIGNQRDQVPPFRYINRADDVSHLVRGRIVLGDMKYLMRSFKGSAKSVGIWIKRIEM